MVEVSPQEVKDGVCLGDSLVDLFFFPAKVVGDGNSRVGCFSDLFEGHSLDVVLLSRCKDLLMVVHFLVLNTIMMDHHPEFTPFVELVEVKLKLHYV